MLLIVQNKILKVMLRFFPFTFPPLSQLSFKCVLILFSSPHPLPPPPLSFSLWDLTWTLRKGTECSRSLTGLSVAGLHHFVEPGTQNIWEWQSPSLSVGNIAQHVFIYAGIYYFLSKWLTFHFSWEKKIEHVTTSFPHLSQDSGTGQSWTEYFWTSESEK